MPATPTGRAATSAATLLDGRRHASRSEPRRSRSAARPSASACRSWSSSTRTDRQSSALDVEHKLKVTSTPAGGRFLALARRPAACTTGPRRTGRPAARCSSRSGWRGSRPATRCTASGDRIDRVPASAARMISMVDIGTHHMTVDAERQDDPDDPDQHRQGRLRDTRRGIKVVMSRRRPHKIMDRDHGIGTREQPELLPPRPCYVHRAGDQQRGVPPRARPGRSTRRATTTSATAASA